jgi:hypothetical protein
MTGATVRQMLKSPVVEAPAGLDSGQTGPRPEPPHRSRAGQ